ncbi:hypothetical protein C8R43DRAFT_960135 [Mycena crocata]|nr:hypothetical protein C8R43DRAFT_960135 [Mycena crocata]
MASLRKLRLPVAETGAPTESYARLSGRREVWRVRGDSAEKNAPETFRIEREMVEKERIDCYPYGHPLGVNFTSEGSTPKGIFFGWCSQGGWDVPSYTGTLVWDVPLEQWDPEYGTSQPAAGGENFVGYPTCVTSRCPKNWLFQGSWPALGQGAYGPKPLRAGLFLWV